ncbi:amidohydrolase [Priestia taiwanensis]|uniref:Amidohydrolase n=1 Tax=Priestia taiwanensis TaxID=1347902 RepID=A0A917AUR0_9BACI|nr:amidohydrolase [Priestia taiwanensis]MBM7363432.1 putative amidohydrolase YtcJ [Priestia taiwanensis]GGE77229.1 amidohydrolase [Priestia taiwanensis]
MKKLWHGGIIYTMREEGEVVEAVVTDDATIIAIGDKKKLEQEYPIDEYIELQGRTMIPGLVDSHIHLIGHGEMLNRLDLSMCTSMKEVMEKVAEKVAQTPKNQWIVGEGWNENIFLDKKDFSLEEIDVITNSHPIVLKRVCRHSLFVNRLGLQQAGITIDTLSPKGGEIGQKDGELTGMLYDTAQEKVLSLASVPTEAYLKEAVTLAIEDMWKYGITGVHTEDLNYYGSAKLVHHTFQEVVEKGKKRFKLHLLVHHEVVDEMRDIESSHYIEMGPMKIFVDGSLGSRTALLREPYADDTSKKGLALFTKDELATLVHKARTREMAIATHAIGDLAMEYVIDAIEQHGPVNNKRDRLIHCQVLDGALVARMKNLQMVADIQPTFLASDFPWVINRLGEERMTYSYAWRTLLDNGIACSGGSDSPIETANPFIGIYSAVARKSFHGEKDVVYGEQERLTVFEAVSLYTTGSAYASNKENVRGMIQVGYDADFTVIDLDVFGLKIKEIPFIEAVMTIVDGEVVYQRK